MKLSQNAKLNGLVVDDDNALRAFAADVFTAEGYAITAAGDAVEAVQVALEQSESLSFLVTDYELGDVTGVELATTLRRLHPALRVVLMSGRDVREVPRAGVAGQFLRKPFSPMLLCGTLRQALGRTASANPGGTT